MREVEKIAVVNIADFFMHFDIDSINEDTGNYVAIWKSSDYGKDETKSCKISTNADGQIKEGTTIWPEVYDGVPGVKKEGDKVRYRKNGQTAAYTVSGNILSYNIELL